MRASSTAYACAGAEAAARSVAKRMFLKWTRGLPDVLDGGVRMTGFIKSRPPQALYISVSGTSGVFCVTHGRDPGRCRHLFLLQQNGFRSAVVGGCIFTRATNHDGRNPRTPCHV